MVRGTTDRANWGITKAAASGIIWLRFVGPTRTWEIAEFISALSEMMPEEDANIVFDLRELVGHNPETKEPIKAWLRENKARIGQITVLVPKADAILRMVVAVIALATGVKLRVRDHLDEDASVVNL